MKTKLLLLLVSSFIIHHSAFGQGALTPPGAPAPTMKTLAQIEPRTAIASAPFTITQSGSYYLTTNLTVSSGNAITIATNGVTLDLNGFTISSTATIASSGGVAISINNSLRDLSIVNGHIVSGVTNNGSGMYSGSGFGYGINYPSIAPVNTLVSRVTVSGCLYQGIYLNTGDATVVEACTVRTSGGYGIVASTIKSSVAVDCGYNAIEGDQVADCRGVSTGNGNGVNASEADNCFGQSTSGYGLYAVTANNCYGIASGSDASIRVTTANNCYGQNTGSGDAIDATTANNCYGGAGSGVGINAFIASVCHGTSGSGTALSVTHNVNSY